jgi:hypothetical protein
VARFQSTLTDVVSDERYPADFDQRHTVNIYSGYRWSGRTSVSARFRYGSNSPFTDRKRRLTLFLEVINVLNRDDFAAQKARPLHHPDHARTTGW